jgi:hypothetical protein
LSAQGDYELFYQAQIADLALTKTRSFAIDASDHPTVSGSGSAFVFANGGFDAARDVGAVFTVTFDAPNALFSGTYMITAVNSPTSIDTDPSVDPFTFTGPAAGPDVVETYQPVNTINVLPQVINPWQLFLKAHAACTVNAKRDLTNPDIQRTVDQEHARAVQMAQKRTSDLKQSPITRGQGNPLFGPWDGGAFGDGWLRQVPGHHDRGPQSGSGAAECRREVRRAGRRAGVERHHARVWQLHLAADRPLPAREPHQRHHDRPRLSVASVRLDHRQQRPEEMHGEHRRWQDQLWRRGRQREHHDRLGRQGLE